MFIEIHGAGFKNKGAELMLRTTVSELRSRIPNYSLAIDPTYGAYELRCDLALGQMFPPRSHVGTKGFRENFFKQKLFTQVKAKKLLEYLWKVYLNMYGCVTLADTQGLVDISGFAFSDQWGSQPIKDFAQLARYYHLHNRPVVLLPQAFGPFKKEETRSSFRTILKSADLVFARDRVSYQYAKENSPNPERILQAPDITLFYPKVLLSSVDKPSEYVCLVPNSRMLDQGKKLWGEKYELCLAAISQEVIRRGYEVFIIIHDSSGPDLKIAKNLLTQIDSPHISILSEQSPVLIKEFIGNGTLTIGSRYHSLVSSFSKCVPAIALGWSHKYEMLFKDFNCQQFLISHKLSIEDTLKLVDKLIDLDINFLLRKQISERLNVMYEDNCKMWDQVINLFNSPKNKI